MRSLLSIWTFSFDSSSVWICNMDAVSWRAYRRPSGPQRTRSGWSLNDFVNASRPLDRSHALSVLSFAIVKRSLPDGSAEKSRTAAECFNVLISSQSSNDHILQPYTQSPQIQHPILWGKGTTSCPKYHFQPINEDHWVVKNDIWTGWRPFTGDMGTITDLTVQSSAALSMCSS